MTHTQQSDNAAAPVTTRRAGAFVLLPVGSDPRTAADAYMGNRPCTVIRVFPATVPVGMLGVLVDTRWDALEHRTTRVRDVLPAGTVIVKTVNGNASVLSTYECSIPREA